VGVTFMVMVMVIMIVTIPVMVIVSVDMITRMGVILRWLTKNGFAVG
jgi:hypothetical protein